MKNNYELIVPNDYPELKSLFWNSSSARAINPQDALSFYERYWRFIDQNALTESEANLIKYLNNEYGYRYLEKPSYKNIVEALASMNSALLMENKCFFVGGATLTNGEYRQSVDLDFVCSNQDGYRRLRTIAVEKGVKGIFGPNAETLKEFRADQYGIRAVIGWNSQAIKFEIIREARITVAGKLHPTLSVPILHISDQFAEKLLANADRGLDRNYYYRDVIDLGFLTLSNGGIPPEAVLKSQEAYGDDIPKKIQKVMERFSNAVELRYATEALDIEQSDAEKALLALHKASILTWPHLNFIEPYREPDTSFIF